MYKIWIDITNSPHAILYNPIIKKMKNGGYDVIVTARDYAQTKGLLDMFNIKYHLIGDHKGKNKISKILGVIQRSWQLYKFARKQNFDASLSMSSQCAMIASKMLKIPHMTLYDYEYTAGHHIDFRLSDQILTPKGVDEKILKRYGAKIEKVTFYPGLKEQFYIHYYLKEYNKKYKVEEPIRKKLHIPKDNILIVIRPEATVAHYQSNKNPLVFPLIEYLINYSKNLTIIVLPRTNEQKTDFLKRNYKNVIIPHKVINGIELMVTADIVISAGGTVNREAASIGVPTYTIFQGGKLGAVDQMLINDKRMVKIENVEDFKKIKIKKKKNLVQPIGEDFSNLYIEMVGKLVKKR